MINFKNASLKYLLVIVTAMLCFSACSDDTSDVVNPNEGIGKAVGVFTASEWFPGGELGTTSNEQGCYSNPSPYVERNDLYMAFKKGETFFENDFTLNSQPRRGLGPAWVRSGCMYCHPSYGHGKRQDKYLANTMGNGYLLVIYHPDTGGYISEVTGMPQTKAMFPFLPPIDENQISLEWKHATDEHGNRFSDGETYDLIYPEVNIPQSAFNTDPKPTDYVVRLESTIGIYGTGLIDAIPDDSLKVQYAKESKYISLNPAMWDMSASTWTSGAFYKAAYNDLGNFKQRIKRFTYALTRASLQDGPGANAMWNITNVTRADRHFLYTTDAWAKAMSKNTDIISAIQMQGGNKNSWLHPFYSNGSSDSISHLVNYLLGLNSPADTAAYKRHFVMDDAFGEEMKDEDYYDFMVWHRGVGVPQARNLTSEIVQRGKTLFYQMCCVNCHRPSWTTGNDDYWADYIVRNQGPLPRYAHQKIWPYSDFVQHRFFMENDIKGGWCRTTPLWGRGLSEQETGASDRLHDCRARNVTEAIMWHGFNKKSDAYSCAQKFYHLSKSDRSAVIAFIDAI